MDYFQIVNFLLSPGFITSVLFTGALLAVRSMLVKWVASTKSIPEAFKISTLSSVKSGVVAFFLVGMLYIWGEQAQSLLIAVFVFAYAFARAVSGLINCVGGTVVRFRSMAFSVGDRVRIGNVSGEVLDSNVLTTTLLDDSSPGKKVTISNARFLGDPITNNSLISGFAYEKIEISLDRTENWKLAMTLLKTAADEQAASYMEAARRRLSEVEKKLKMELPSPDPRVDQDLSHSGTFKLAVRLLVPLSMKSRVRAEILKSFTEKFYPICSAHELLEKKITGE